MLWLLFMLLLYTLILVALDVVGGCDAAVVVLCAANCANDATAVATVTDWLMFVAASLCLILGHRRRCVHHLWLRLAGAPIRHASWHASGLHTPRAVWLLHHTVTYIIVVKTVVFNIYDRVSVID